MVEVSKLEEKIKKLKEIGKEMRLVSPYEYKILAKDDNLKVDCIKVVADFLNETSEVFNYNDPLNTLNNILPKLKYVEDCPYSFEECLKYEKYYVPVDLHKNFAKAMHAIYECLNNVKSQVPEIEPDLKTISKYLREVIEPKLLEPVTSKLHNAIVNICKELPTPLTKIKNKVVMPAVKIIPFTLINNNFKIFEDPSKVEPYFDLEVQIPPEVKNYTYNYNYKYLVSLPTPIKCTCPNIECVDSPSYLADYIGRFRFGYFYTEGDFIEIQCPSEVWKYQCTYQYYCKGWYGYTRVVSCDENYCYTDFIFPYVLPCKESYDPFLQTYSCGVEDYDLIVIQPVDSVEKGVFEVEEWLALWEVPTEIGVLVFVSLLGFLFKLRGERMVRLFDYLLAGKYLNRGYRTYRVPIEYGGYTHYFHIYHYLHFYSKNVDFYNIPSRPWAEAFVKGLAFPINLVFLEDVTDYEIITEYSPPQGEMKEFTYNYVAKFTNYYEEIVLEKNVVDPITEVAGDLKVILQEVYNPDEDTSTLYLGVGFCRDYYRVLSISSGDLTRDYSSVIFGFKYILGSNRELKYWEYGSYQDNTYNLSDFVELSKEYVTFLYSLIITFCRDGTCTTTDKMLVQHFVSDVRNPETYEKLPIKCKVKPLNWE